ncbi:MULTISPECIES: hypothetical protein [unclassified Nocardioides]|uniref:hypothetical protein n=1 Tax=unclassified Nocardioides TaxID=2615069 RepID=UPI0036125BB3
MPVSHLAGRRARIDVSLDGIRFTRSQPDAERRDTARVRDIEWEQVTGASVHTSRKGRAVIRVAVVGAPEVEHHRADPFALKVPRRLTATAYDLVAHINDEVAGRRRWREPS